MSGILPLPDRTRGAKSRAAYEITSAPIAQLVEHLICNQGVRGSSPCGGTIFFNYINNLSDFRIYRNLLIFDLEAIWKHI